LDDAAAEALDAEVDAAEPDAVERDAPEVGSAVADDVGCCDPVGWALDTGVTSEDAAPPTGVLGRESVQADASASAATASRTA